MPNPATIGHVEARWRPLTAAEQVNAVAFLDDAWALLLARQPTLEANMTAATVSTANVIRVVVAMVLRLLRNPDGKTEEAIDDYRYRYDRLVASGRLFVSDEELADITPTGYKRAKSVRLVAYGDT